MILTDTHTHIYYETELQKRNELVERALKNEITRMFLPNVNGKSIPFIKSLVHDYPKNCFAMLGLHPCDVKEDFLTELEIIRKASLSQQIYAIGEIGIDLYWDKTTLDIQQDAFKRQIAWAKDMSLPIVIHCRDAFDEVYEILSYESGTNLKGIFHCFTGSIEQAKLIMDLGFYLGIGGVVTYKNSGLAEVVAQIPLENIVLETDSPYLPPVPFRGKPNETSYLTYIAQKVADLHQKPIELIADITTENSKKIFSI